MGKMNFRATLFRAWLISIILLFLVGVILLVCGAIFGANKSLLITGVICVTIAVPMLLFYIGVNRCRKQRNQCKGQINGQVSTIYPPEYYTQTPPGLKTDYPMGPFLIMTLPRSREDRRGSCPYEESANSTPSISCHRKLNMNRKNVPPLASAETLTPSLLSASTGFDSVI